MKKKEFKKSEFHSRARGKIIYTEYNSINEMANDINNKEANKVFKGEQQSISGSKNFTKTKSYEEASDLLLNGWEEGSKNLNLKLKLANAKIQDKTVQKTIYDLVGFQASVPRYLQGIPQNMVSKKTVKQKAKVITLNKPAQYSGMVSAERILEDSIKFLQTVQGIEKQGIRVRINLVFMSTSNSTKNSIFIKVKVKDATERLNISKLSFPLVHPSFLRRIIFRAMEVEERLEDSSFRHGYGMAAGNNDMKQVMENNEYTYNNLNNIPLDDAIKALTDLGIK